VHHILPNIHWIHYPALYPIICDALSQPEVARKSYAETMRMHLRHVGALNNRGATEGKENFVLKAKENVQHPNGCADSPIDTCIATKQKMM